MYYYCTQAYSFTRQERGKKKKIYIQTAQKYSALVQSLVHRQGAGLSALTQCSSDLVYAWNTNSRAQRAFTV
jgi:hypothetical protein